MKKYEKINDKCQMLWIENCELNNQKKTQVSGYVFNKDNKLLIVKNGEKWTIPGGHYEKGDTELETLNRELMEEACVTLKEIKYLGAVEVLENEEIYYQLRYTAKVDKELPFKQEWEISERKFISLSELDNYIEWANGITFKSQIKSAIKYWGYEL